MSDYNEAFNNLINVSKQLNKMISPQLVEMQTTLKLFSDKLNEMIKPVITQIASTEYMSPLFEQFRKYAELFEKAKANPDSVFNYYRYSHKLNDFHWTWPYGMNSDSMLSAIEKIESEIEFDNWLLECFDEEKMKNLLEDIQNGISEKYRIAIEQIIIGLQDNSYVLINNTLLSIIDGVLSKYVANKKNVRRRGILEPIIAFYDDNYSLETIPFIFELGMLENNIQFIFEDSDFNLDIEVETNKKVRRHSAVHGMAFSNNYNDTIFLLNALYWLIALEDVLVPFENSLKVKDGKFVIKSDCIKDVTSKIDEYMKTKQKEGGFGDD